MDNEEYLKGESDDAAAPQTEADGIASEEWPPGAAEEENQTEEISEAREYLLTPESENKKKSPFVFVLAALLILAAVGAAAAFAVFTQNPAKKLAKAKEVTARDYQAVLGNALFTQTPEYIELTPQTNMDFSVDIVSVIPKTGMPLAFLNGSRLSGALNIDETAQRLDAELSVTLQGENVASAHVNLDDTFLSLNVPELFGEKYYGVDLETLNEDLAQSFWPELQGILPDDAAQTMKEIFSLSEKMNELSARAYGSGTQSESLAEIPVRFSRILSEADASAEIKKTEDSEVDGVKCKTYTVAYQEAVVKELLNEFADIFGEKIDELYDAIDDSLPGAADNYRAELEREIEEIYAQIDKITLEEPLYAKYYVDGGNIIRRATYDLAFLSGGEESQLALDIQRTGEGNAYDFVAVNFEAKTEGLLFALDIKSKGSHADPLKFSDSSDIRLKLDDSDAGLSEEVTITSDLSYDSSAKETEFELGFENASQPGRYAFGFKCADESDAASKTSRLTFNDLYFESPGLDFSFGASFGAAPAQSPPKTREDVNPAEVLKMSEMELFDAYMEIYANYETLLQKLLGMFGLGS